MAALLGRGRAAALAFSRRHNRFKTFCYASSTSCKLEQPALNENSSSMYERILPFSRTYNTSSPFPAFLNGKYRHPQKLIPEVRYFASGADGTVDVLVPPMGESITDGTVAAFLKKPGESVVADDIIAQIETDKVTVDVRTPEGGVVEQLLFNVGDTVQPGRKIAVVTKGGTASATVTEKTEPVGTEPRPSVSSPPPQPSVSSVPPSPPPKSSEPKPPQIPVEMKARHPAASEPILPLKDKERRVPMTRLRKRVAARLKDSQNTFALLTTFNEIDMTNLMQLRSKYKDAFQERHGVKLGFMSAFVKAAVSALEQQAVVNAVIDGDDIIYRDYVDISIAVATPKGLVVPVIRGADRLNFAEIEKTIADLGRKAKDGTISIDDMAGGTFTISNGGVYGSVLSTPIINPPQSAILGMHKVISRATVIGENIVPRPIMNVALTYDHRLIDGREAVLFLSRIKDVVEDPSRLLLDV